MVFASGKQYVYTHMCVYIYIYVCKNVYTHMMSIKRHYYTHEAIRTTLAHADC